jgi:hypothetical protein
MKNYKIPDPLDTQELLEEALTVVIGNCPRCLSATKINETCKEITLHYSKYYDKYIKNL